MSQKLEQVDSFKDDYEKFRNFYPVVIHFESINFPSVEHAYVAAKSTDIFFRKRIAELPADQAGKAKIMGRKVFIRLDWDMVKIAYMKRFLHQKFAYDEFRSLLLSTGDMLLIEGNYWHDNYWGDCYCPKCKDIKGKNNLGKLLMKVRKEITN